ncbi:hypothetical protein FGO68_gene6251 [Halteria grandinella]|uniref:TRP C-terminal domain-containing protein n=1 Tax=Halteria grandinella TaxID=5974 RepID=A0A8J8P4L2_HALGN|nr:hypothetical protein FGO68_gene6251 [Halteria grandinella]
MIQQYQTILISSLITIKLYLNTFTLSLEDYQSKTSNLADSISVYLALAFLTICIIFPIAMISIIYRNQPKLKSVAFQESYGTLIQGLRVRVRAKKIREKVTPYWNVIAMVRWGASIVTFVFLKDAPAIQIILNIMLSLLFTILTAYIKPFESGTANSSINENSFKIFNEILVTYYLILMLMLTDITTDQDLRKIVGLAELGIIGVCVLSNIIKAVLAGINELCRRRKLKQAKQLPIQSKSPALKHPIITPSIKQKISLKPKRSLTKKKTKRNTFSTNNDLSLTDLTSPSCYVFDEREDARIREAKGDQISRNEVYLPFHGGLQPAQFSYSRAIADEVLRRASLFRVQQNLLTNPTLGRESAYKSTLHLPPEQKYYEQGI